MKKSDNDINKWGLLNSLISLVNEGAEDKSEVTIAKCLLKNYNHIQDLNIYNIAEECFVSRATIRRMAKKLGFDNFKDLKSQFSDFSDNYSFYRTGIDNDILGNTVARQIFNMAIECDQFFTDNKIELTIQQMKKASQIVFLTSDIYSRQSSEFQKAMILSGKMVRVVSAKFDENEMIQKLKASDILIVISISGFFVSLAMPFVEKSKARKILLTTVQEELHKSIFDEIWYLSSEPKVEHRGVYTVYATQYCLEKIFTAYIKKYGK